jgi:hypothetical protein
MSTSEPKKDEAPASESAAEPDPPNAALLPVTTTEATAAANLGTAPEAPSSAAPDQASADEPVWPPPESQPVEPSGEPPLGAKPDEPAVLTKTEEPSRDAKPDQRAVAPDDPASEPKQEMGLSESTLHWLVDGEQPIEASEPNPILVPVYDPHAPVAGRKRTFAIIGGAAIVALGIAAVLHAQAVSHRAAVVAPTVETAGLLIRRAVDALAQGRRVEAMDLAHLAIATDPGFADAYVVIGAIQRSNGQVNDARVSYRRYLELAPLGTHAGEARAALTSLPP